MEHSAEIIAVASVAVNVILVYVVTHQYRRSSQQYEKMNRPWLVLTRGKDIGDFIGWYLENIGNLPAEEITIATKSDLDSKKSDIEKELINIGIVMPKQSYSFILDYLERDVFIDAKKMDIEFTIKYKFLDHEKKSEFRYDRVALAGIDEIICVEAD